MTAKTIVACATIALGCAVAMPAMAKSNKAFLKDAIMGDNAEITMGNYMAEHGATKGVRDLGQTLVSDHTQAKNQAEQVASQMNVKPPSGTKEQAKMEMKKLKGLQGKALDRQFLKDAVKDHKKDIAEFKQEAKKGNGPVPQMAQKQLPVLQKHLKMAQSLQSS